MKHCSLPCQSTASIRLTAGQSDMGSRNLLRARKLVGQLSGVSVKDSIIATVPLRHLWSLLWHYSKWCVSTHGLKVTMNDAKRMMRTIIDGWIDRHNDIFHHAQPDRLQHSTLYFKIMNVNIFQAEHSGHRKKRTFFPSKEAESDLHRSSLIQNRLHHEHLD